MPEIVHVHTFVPRAKMVAEVPAKAVPAASTEPKQRLKPPPSKRLQTLAECVVRAHERLGDGAPAGDASARHSERLT